LAKTYQCASGENILPTSRSSRANKKPRLNGRRGFI
jgi:hypothetical protein